MFERSETIEIRRVTAGDLGHVAALHRLGLVDTGADAGPGPWDDDLRDIEGVYLRKGGEFLVGVVDGKIVAMGAVRLDGEAAEVKRMRVRPGLQRRGFGRLILERLEAHAAASGARRVWLETTTLQTGAQSFYLGAGYREVERGTFGRFETITYAKELIAPAAPEDRSID